QAGYFHKKTIHNVHRRPADLTVPGVSLRSLTCSVAEARCLDNYSALLRASHPRQPRLVRNSG
ncbi:MAG: hypothetical protein V2I36_11020, partial [Desulfopila sp.]|nr:hypothetical protein [Desulfopila sp.]